MSWRYGSVRGRGALIMGGRDLVDCGINGGKREREWGDGSMEEKDEFKKNMAGKILLSAGGNFSHFLSRKVLQAITKNMT